VVSTNSGLAGGEVVVGAIAVWAPNSIDKSAIVEGMAPFSTDAVGSVVAIEGGGLKIEGLKTGGGLKIEGLKTGGVLKTGGGLTTGGGLMTGGGLATVGRLTTTVWSTTGWSTT
jgi:hypothetical protein